MQPRSENIATVHQRGMMGASLRPAREGTRSERVREIRRRIADDAYRTSEVAEEIARRILLAREL
jgi:hypothetical protein